ncbi:MAG: DUF4906 domain-containing protein, partial [Alistipes sp.]|nr:DUF4906 domain-containing protein [Alistipes sp.]
MKIFQKTLLIAAAALAFAACSEDFDATVDNSETGGLQPVGEKVTMTLNFSVPEMNVVAATPESRAVAEDESLSVALDAATRADDDEDPTVPATAAESKIFNLWVMQFSGTGVNSTLQVGQYYDTISSDNTVSVDLYDANGNPTTTYFIANVGEDALKGFTGRLSSFMQKTFATPEGGFGGAYLTSKGLPMVAKYDLKAVTGTQEIKLERICAKVVLTLKQDAAFGAFVADTDVNLCSAATKFYYANNVDSLKSVKTNYIDQLVSHSINVNNLKNASGSSVTFYIPENMRGDGTSTTKQSKNWWNAPAHSSYLEITGTYTNPSNGAKAKKIAYRIFPGTDDTKNYDIKRNTCYNITATIKGANANGDGRVTTADVIDLSAAGTANCYLTHEAGQVYVFNAATGGNGATTQAFSATTGIAPNTKTQNAPAINPFTVNPATVSLLWETGTTTNGLIKNVKLDVENKKVYFSTAGMIGMPAIEGNALLAVNDAAGAVAWSWHIWSTQYDPDTAAPVTHVGGSRSYQAMDRNLGASDAGLTTAAYGLYYQWGRKDPFLGSGMTAVGPKATMSVLATADQATAGTTTSARIAYARQNPTTFICQRDAVVYDWLGITDWTTQADNLWGNPNTQTTINKTSYNTNKGAKSIYDPCPVGWRVPPQDTWIQFVKNVTWTNQYGSTTAADFNVANTTFSNGWKFYTNYAQTITADYPAAGYRYGTSGALAPVGARGAYWASSSFAAGNVNASHL